MSCSRAAAHLLSGFSPSSLNSPAASCHVVAARSISRLLKLASGLGSGEVSGEDARGCNLHATEQRQAGNWRRGRSGTRRGVALAAAPRASARGRRCGAWPPACCCSSMLSEAARRELHTAEVRKPARAPRRTRGPHLRPSRACRASAGARGSPCRAQTRAARRCPCRPRPPRHGSGAQAQRARRALRPGARPLPVVCASGMGGRGAHWHGTHMACWISTWSTKQSCTAAVGIGGRAGTAPRPRGRAKQRGAAAARARCRLAHMLDPRGQLNGTHCYIGADELIAITLLPLAPGAPLEVLVAFSCNACAPYDVRRVCNIGSARISCMHSYDKLCARAGVCCGCVAAAAGWSARPFPAAGTCTGHIGQQVLPQQAFPGTYETHIEHPSSLPWIEGRRRGCIWLRTTGVCSSTHAECIDTMSIPYFMPPVDLAPHPELKPHTPTLFVGSAGTAGHPLPPAGGAAFAHVRVAK